MPTTGVLVSILHMRDPGCQPPVAPLPVMPGIPSNSALGWKAAAASSSVALSFLSRAVMIRLECFLVTRIGTARIIDPIAIGSSLRLEGQGHKHYRPPAFQQRIVGLIARPVISGARRAAGSLWQ